VADLFISYAEADRGTAVELVHGLEAAGYTVWNYKRDMPVGGDHVKIVGLEIERAKAFVLIVSQKSLGSFSITTEISHAHRKSVPIIPIFLGVSHDEFRTRQPLWCDMIGLAAAQVIPPEGVSLVVPRLVEGLVSLEVFPSSQGGFSIAGLAARVVRAGARMRRRTLWMLGMSALGAPIIVLVILQVRGEPHRGAMGQDVRSLERRRHDLELLRQNLGNIEDVVGLSISKRSGSVFLIGRKSSSPVQMALTVEDLAFCLEWAGLPDPPPFGCVLEPPTDSENEDVLDVKFFGGVEHTHFGFLLVQADRALKEYSMGYRMDGRPMRSTVEDYRGMLEILQKTKGTRVARASFWLQCDPLLQVSSDGNVAVVKETGISVGVGVDEVWQNGAFVPSPESKDSCREFARRFTEEYESFAAEEPAFSGFVRVVQTVALARWLADSDVASSTAWASAYVESRYDMPAKLPRIQYDSQTKERSGDNLAVSRTTRVIGGVSVGLPARVTTLDDALSSAIERELRDTTTKASIDLDIPNGQYVALLLYAPDD
jgi:hypothetical protein